jgi:hypothetical protein
MARAENIRVIYSDLSEEWHWKAGRHRKSHIRFGEGVLEKYRRKRQLAGSLLYVMSGSEGAGLRQRSPATRHITMRLTVLSQYTKGLAHHNPVEALALHSRLDRIKWRLWHGGRASRNLSRFFISILSLN